MEAEFGRIIKSTDAFALLSCPTPGTGKASFPRPRRFCSEKREMEGIVSNRECGIIAAGV